MSYPLKSVESFTYSKNKEISCYFSCIYSGCILLGLFRNRNTRNRRYLCSFHSAPDSRMNRMEGKRFSRNRQNTSSFGKFLAGNPTRPPCSLTLECVRRYSSSQVTSDSVSRSETCRSVLSEIEIPCILLFLNRNKNSQNSPKRMHPQSVISQGLLSVFSFLQSYGCSCYDYRLRK